MPEFEQFEAVRFDLRKDAEQCESILEQAGEHGLAALQLMHIEGKAGRAMAGVDWGSEEHAKRLA